MSTTTTVQQEPLELTIQVNSNGHASATVPIRWSVSEETIQELARAEAKDPHIAMIVSDEGYEMSRHLIPLKAGMTYLPMKRAGYQIIHAAIIWRSPGADALKRTFFSRSNLYLERYRQGEDELREQRNRAREDLENHANSNDRLYETAKQRYNHINRRLDAMMESEPLLTRMVFSDYDHEIDTLPLRAEARVVIPSQMFAADPPEWMDWLARLYPTWKTEPRDQCDVRRRMIITLATLPVALICALLALAIFLFVKAAHLVWVLLLLLCGKWAQDRSDYEILYHFDEYGFSEYASYTRPSLWLYGRKNELHPNAGFTSKYRYEKQHAFLAGFNPVTIILALLLVWLVSVSGLYVMSAMSMLLVALIVAVVAGVVAIVVRRQQLVSDDKMAQTADRQAELTRQLAALTKHGEASLEALPPVKRTVHLRYLDLKSRVCKPFQQ